MALSSSPYRGCPASRLPLAEGASLPPPPSLVARSLPIPFSTLLGGRQGQIQGQPRGRNSCACSRLVPASRPGQGKSRGRGTGRGARIVVRAAEEAPVKEAAPAKPALAKGNIVRVDREKYINSVEFKAVDHPPYFKGLDYIYEARGEILDLRSFSTGDYALIAWAGIPTAPAWLPTYMLVKAPKLEYKRV